MTGALEARDAIGEMFYVSHLDTVPDRALYHFDYLSLLLFGAFDVLARIAHRCYNVTTEERFAGFHNKKFRKELLNNGAQNLVALVSSKQVQDILEVLRILRNNIHGAATTGMFGGSPANLNAPMVVTPDQDGPGLLTAFGRLGSLETWGVTQRWVRSNAPFNILIEPYTYAVKMLQDCLPVINEIMANTEVQRMLPLNVPLSEMRTGPGLDNYYPPFVRARLALLG